MTKQSDLVVQDGQVNRDHGEKPTIAHDDAALPEDAESNPHLHAKTFLAVFAVCLIYYVQVYNVVGAGAASPVPRGFLP